MTTPIIPPVPPLGVDITPIPNVQPFTFRDGLSFIQRYELLVKYLNRVILPYVNTLGGAWTTQMEQLVELVNSAVEDMGEDVAAAEAAAAAAAASEAQAAIYASEAASVQDVAMTAIFNNVASAFRIALNGAYATKATQTTVETGRLSAATLDPRFTAKADKTAVDADIADLAAYKTSNNTAVAAVDTKVNNVSPATIGAGKARVHIVMALGQSNMQGHGTPYSSTLDPSNPRILQYGAHTLALAPATEPLDMPDNAITGTPPSGIGPALQFARHMLNDLPKDDVIVIVPAAVGSSALIGSGVNDWQWGGAAGNLSADAVVQANAAKAAAAVSYPKHTIVMGAYLWHQGERDGTNNVTMAAYNTALGNLITGFRGALGSAPFIVGQMVPEAMADGSRKAINEAHTRAPYNFTEVGFAAGPAGQTADNIHYNGPGQRQLAKEYYRVYKRIIGKLAPDNPVVLSTVATMPSNQDDWILQSGSLAHLPTDTAGQNVTVTFPKPFGGVPVVIAQGHLGSTGIYVYAYAGGVTATDFSLRSRATAGGGSSQVLAWMAFGPKYEGN